MNFAVLISGRDIMDTNRCELRNNENATSAEVERFSSFRKERKGRRERIVVSMVLCACCDLFCCHCSKQREERHQVSLSCSLVGWGVSLIFADVGSGTFCTYHDGNTRVGGSQINSDHIARIIGFPSSSKKAIGSRSSKRWLLESCRCC